MYENCVDYQTMYEKKFASHTDSPGEVNDS